MDPRHPHHPIPGKPLFVRRSDYLLPKDDDERDRLDFQDYVLYQARKTPYVAPLSSPPTVVLDVGTGTGTWAIKMAWRFPEAQVIGVDRDPTFFKKHTRANCQLHIGDVLTGLPFPDGTFSLTHQRLLIAAIPAHKWPTVVEELVRVTSVGGWVELTEIDTVIQHAGLSTWQLQRKTHEIARDLGFERWPVQRLGEILRQMGLASVTQRTIAVPLGAWGGRVGVLMKQNLLQVFQALKGVYCKSGMEISTYEEMVQLMAEEWEQLHCSCTFVTVYGKRVHP